MKPYAKQGPANVGNISLRCRRHNLYEAELIFGAHGASVVREGPELFVPRPMPAFVGAEPPSSDAYSSERGRDSQENH